VLFLVNHISYRSRISDGMEMNNLKVVMKSSLFYQVLLCLYLFLYIMLGIYTELKLIEIKPIPDTLLEDFGYYERALHDALNGQNPYATRSIGIGYLYPPPALLIIEIFHYIDPYLKALLYSTVNIVLLILIVYGTARYYGYSAEKVWYWYVICLGFAPFLELIHIGQINIITLFGIFMLFFWMSTFPFLSAIGLGLAVITKVSPVLFFLYLFVHRRYSILVLATIFIVCITYLSALRYGFLPVLEYPSVFQWLTVQFPMGANSQSLVSKLAAIGNTIRSNDIITGLHLTVLQKLILSFSSFLSSNHLAIQRILTIYILMVIVVSGLLTRYGEQPREPMFMITTLGMMLSPNVMWYHHYVFMLFPILIWMGWSRLNWRVVTWCLVGLLIVQIDRRWWTYGLLIHVFGHLSLLSILLWQLRAFYSRQK